MKLIQIYECLCDETRLRILNLLIEAPLCVCHFQEVLDRPQVHISKHLAYLRQKGMVEAARHQNWMIYSLPVKKSRELDANLKCLQDCVGSHPVFKRDLKKLQKMRGNIAWLDGVSPCCSPTPMDREACGPTKAAKPRKARSC